MPEAKPPLKTYAKRAAALGLSFGALLGGAALEISAWLTLHAAQDCQQLAASECAFERANARDFARWQIWVGVALELLAVGIFLWVRALERNARKEVAR